jgi:uncharacterized protein YkwD
MPQHRLLPTIIALALVALSAPAGAAASKGSRRCHIHHQCHLRQLHPSTTATRLSTAPATSSEPAVPCQNTTLIPSEENLPVIREATLCLVDQERALHGEAPLRVDTRLERAAQLHSQQMVSEGYFNHVSPSGETPVDRVKAAGYIPSSRVGYTIGENIAWGTLAFETPQAIVNAWIASPEHLANILEAHYEDTGFGVAIGVPLSPAEARPGATYTEDFGVITP